MDNISITYSLYCTYIQLHVVHACYTECLIEDPSVRQCGQADIGIRRIFRDGHSDGDPHVLTIGKVPFGEQL